MKLLFEAIERFGEDEQALIPDSWKA